MPIQISYAETLRQGTDKINGILGNDSGVMDSPYELTFNVYHRIRTLEVDEDIEISFDLAAAVSNTFETVITTGDGSHNLTFDPDIIMLGDLFNNDKVQSIDFRYLNNAIVGVITTLADVPFPPSLSSATMTGAESGTQTLDLVFDRSVNITTSGWSVSASGGAVTVSSVASGDGTTTPKFSLSRVIQSDETLTASYNPSTGATTSVSGGGELDTVSAQSVTNNVYEILLEVLFTGTSIDTSKGTVTNPDSANLTISQSGKLIFKRTTDNAVASSLTNYWRSTNTYSYASKVYAALLNRDTGFAAGSIAVMMVRVDANNYVAILQNSGAQTVSTRVTIGGSNSDQSTSVNVSNRFRIVINASNQVTFQYYTGGVWTNFGHSANTAANIGSTVNLQFSTNSSVSDATNDQFSFDDVYITDKIYSTATP